MISTRRAEGGAPLVTLGLPVYNGARYLYACLDSLTAQTYPNYEIVISDNASTDETVSIVESYAKRDPRIRLSRAPSNGGTAWNHNRVLELARGEFFRWCGADDVIDTRFVTTCVATLQSSPESVLAFPKSVVIDEWGRTVERTRETLPLNSPDPVVRFQTVLRSLPPTQNAFYGLIRTASLRQVRPLGTFMANDRCLLAELTLLGPFAHVPEFLIYRRKHADNIVRGTKEEFRLLTPDDVPAYRPREWGVLRANLSAIGRATLPGKTKLALLSALSEWFLSERTEFLGECREVASHAVRRLRSRTQVRRRLNVENHVASGFDA